MAAGSARSVAVGSDSDIEWTDATWSAGVRGCALESPGCENCYAMKFAHRFSGAGGRYEGLTVVGNHGPRWTGEVRLVPERLAEPLRWKKPRRIFVSSMSDLFHEDVPDEHIAAAFGVMAACPQHTFQVLTKRAERMARWFDWIATRASQSAPADPDNPWWPVNECVALAGKLLGADPMGAGAQSWPLPNVWIGVSVEDQRRADERIPRLLSVPTAVRFLSVEPLLEHIDLNRIDATKAGWHAVNGFEEPTAISAFGRWQEKPMRARLQNGIDWVIVGGESGPGARPMHPDWARSLRDQCMTAHVPFLFKQWGAWAEIPYDHENPPGDRPRERYLNAAGGHGFHGESVVRIRTARKKDNGRQLDGRTWDQFPHTTRT
jgi:protein gp37